MATCPFVDGVPEYRIADGLMHITIGGDYAMCMPLRVFEQGMARAQGVIAEYYARKAIVLPLRQRSD